MKDAVLIGLAERWKAEAETPETVGGSEDTAVSDAIKQGDRRTKRECAETLLTLVRLLGDVENGK